MAGSETDPETEAMLAGAEVEKGAAEEDGVGHTVRTHPADMPPRPGEDEQPLLTTDPEAQQDDSVIEPTSS